MSTTFKEKHNLTRVTNAIIHVCNLNWTLEKLNALTDIELLKIKGIGPDSVLLARKVIMERLAAETVTPPPKTGTLIDFVTWGAEFRREWLFQFGQTCDQDFVDSFRERFVRGETPQQAVQDETDSMMEDLEIPIS